MTIPDKDQKLVNPSVIHHRQNAFNSTKWSYVCFPNSDTRISTGKRQFLSPNIQNAKQS